MTDSSLLLGLVGVGVAILVAAVPWAFYIGQRLASIDGKVSVIDDHEERLDEHENRITTLEARRAS